MGKMGKGLVIALIVVMAIANSSFLTIKPVIAQYNTPSISIVYPTNGTIVNANMGTVGIQWQYPANSTFSWAGYNLNGGGNITVTGTDHLFDIENNGDYTFTLYANDTAGNWATPQTVTYHVHVIGDALPVNMTAVIADIALILAVIIFFALVLFVAYRRHRKTANSGK
jgi:hypothetical protein